MNLGVVLLETPWTRYSVNSLTAALESRSSTRVHVLNLLKSFELIYELKMKYDKLLVGTSLNTYMLTRDDVLKSLLLLRNLKDSSVLTVAGGPHATGDPLGTLFSLGFDVAVISEGEETFLEIATALAEGGDICRVRGLVTVINGKPVFTGARGKVSLDNYPPFPYWRGVVNPIEIARGCPYGCSYCQVSYMHGFKQRYRGIDCVIENAARAAKLGFRDLRFITPNGLGYGAEGPGKPRFDIVEELLEKLKKKVAEVYGARIFYGSFPSEVRPEYVTEESAKMLKKYVSNKRVIIGAQSGSERILRAIRRGHTIDDIYEAFTALTKAGFRVDVDFILGFPWESNDDYNETLKVIERLASMGAVIHLHSFIPLPGTPLAAAKPRQLPNWVKKKVSKLVGSGRAYGAWMNQESISLKIVELRRRGIISTGSKYCLEGGVRG
ncbi:MAG: TIGR04013 family B12-binding domain/radical SAM domain-containing protein [Desulfurococcaceae archaeon]|nr:TIGR04013 family B12-binding domain/radical SAM domain-containing protein [Sulfolobales archaeon]MDW8170012.1 TIGR04013 family B12-binding domain/radical SAM domain-containing protein [Desulfurococcaceae archaeon]